MLKHRKSLSWGDYYNDTIHKHYENKRFAFGDKSLFITSGNTYIYNCYFYKLTAENGGAIHYSVKGSYFYSDEEIFESSKLNLSYKKINENLYDVYILDEKHRFNKAQLLYLIDIINKKN